jgi:rod shape-determining protein MreC
MPVGISALRRRRNNRVATIVVAGALVVTAGAIGWLSPLGWLYDHTLVPIGHDLTSAGSGTGNFFHTASQLQSLASDNAQLQQQNDQLKAQIAQMSAIQRQNDTLRQQLGLQITGSTQTVAADVVAYEPDSYRQFLTINRGTKNGLANGMAVTSQGLLVGVLDSVTATSSKVLLVTDPQFKLAVIDQDTQAYGVVQGQLGSGLTMGEIAQTDKINPGDTVVTSGLGGVIPRGIPIGTVQAASGAQNAIFQSAQVTTDIVPTHLQLVFVVTSS